MDNKLLLRSMPCSKGEDECSGTMRASQRAGRPSGATLRCTKNRNHELAIRTNSFFENSKLCIQDIFMFVRCYLDGMSLKQTSVFAGVHYKTTAVDWASFMREIFKEYFHRNIKHRMLTGEVEIDESLFGRRVKFHRGNPNKGLKVWVFGMVERSSNTVILYPVEDRSTATLIPLIERHIEKGSTIYSDGWTAYCRLNELGYRHFSVLHKYAFRKDYKNLETGDIITVHTNRIEGAWKHAKDHFRKMSGTKATQWEGHMAEVMWRADVKGNTYEAFFDLLRSIYTLHQPAHYQYATPLFDSWPGAAGNLGKWSVEPEVTDAGSESASGLDDYPDSDSVGTPLIPQSTASTNTTADVLVISSDDDIPTAAQRQNKPANLLPETVALLSDLFSDSSLDETVVEAATTPPVVAGTSTTKHTGARKKTKTDNVCHPPGYAPIKSAKFRSTAQKKKQSNPYSKSIYFVWSSSDDDFQ